MAAQVARVRARARPWQSIIFLVLALGGLAAGEYGRFGRHLGDPVRPALEYGGAALFLLFGLIAAFGLSGQARGLLQPVVGAAHAGVARYALVLIGIFVVAVVTLNIADVPVGQLVLGGAVTGVLLGIAAQQSLANLFAGMVLLLARPFRVGDRVRLRAGALSGTLEGIVTDISITYVRLETDEGLLFVPNSQALAATIGPITSAGAAEGAPADGAAASLADSALAGSPGNEAIIAVVASAAASAAASAVAASQGSVVRPAEAASAAVASVTRPAGDDGPAGAGPAVAGPAVAGAALADAAGERPHDDGAGRG
jgi:hypothetical protein